MTERRQQRGRAGAALALAALTAAALLPCETAAQSSGPDFLFKAPRATLGVHVGFAAPRGQSEVFDFTREQLTFERSELDGASFGAQLGIRASERVEIALDVASVRSQTRTEFRDWVDTDDRPIEQTTYFTRVPASLSAKLYLAERGHSVSRFVWIPAKVAPYLGAGAGLTWYVFEQDGDWVDFETYEVFYDNFRSDGRAETVHAMGGLDVSLGPRFFLNTEARYLWGKAPMDDGDFVGFDDIDLSGFTVTAGLSVRF